MARQDGMIESCYVCASAVTEKEAKKRRVKLKGKGGLTAINALKELFSTEYLWLQQLNDAQLHEDAFLCYKCNTKLSKYAKQLKTIRELEGEIKRFDLLNYIHECVSFCVFRLFDNNTRHRLSESSQNGPGLESTTPSRSYRDRSPHDATNVGTFYAHLIIIIATCISLM